MKKQILSAIVMASVAMSGTSLFAAKDAMMQHDSNIVDVTNGVEFRGISTSPDAAGHATSYYSEEDGYKIHWKFAGLTDPLGDDFYEGWVVRQSPFAFISTGVLTKEEDGYYHNIFESDTDYSDYDFYVLTLEPNDGNDAPADHILEGDVIMGEMKDTMMEKNGQHHIIDITGENFEFSQDIIEVYEGDTITVNFESTWGFHDWGIDEFDAWTEQVSQGGKTSVTFTADKSGRFEYYCSVGNHRSLGMSGWLIVKEKRDDTMMKDAMMDKADMMKSEMMDQEVSATQKALRTKIKARLNGVDVSGVDLVAVKQRISDYKANLSSDITETRRAQTYEVLDAILYVIMDLKAQ